MHLDVVELRDFYATRLGQIARRFLSRQIRAQWPDVRTLRVLGLGYAVPYLRPFLGEAERVLAFMPAAQGVVPWPREGPNVAALVAEDALPLPDASMDRVLIVHALETSESFRPLLRQVWRVLAPAGRVLIVTPNRRSLWALTESTPFGHGHPYSRGQLSRLLTDAMFTPEETRHALHMPPFSSRLLVRTGSAWESTGRRLWPGLAGVLLVEATKQVYGVTPAKGLRVRDASPVRLLKPLAAPQPISAPAKDGPDFIPAKRAVPCGSRQR